MESIKFTVYAKPTPQGSMKGFVIPGKKGNKARAIITSDNKALKPYRQELTLAAYAVIGDRGSPYAAKHVPVAVRFDFYLKKPPSVSKKRSYMVVKPDIDKICRSSIDSMTGILWHDDAAIVSLNAMKHYGSPERVEITVQILE